MHQAGGEAGKALPLEAAYHDHRGRVFLTISLSSIVLSHFGCVCVAFHRVGQDSITTLVSSPVEASSNTVASTRLGGREGEWASRQNQEDWACSQAGKPPGMG